MEEIGLHIPESINDISLRDYQKFMKIYNENGAESSEFTNIKMLEIFCGLKYKDINDLPLGIFDEAIELLGNSLSQKTPLVRRFDIKGSDGFVVDLGFIPNLDKITLGEYIDLSSYLDDIDSIHKAMAVLYRPVHKSFKNKEAYRIAEYKGTDKYSEAMKDMPLGVALGARVFFYHLGMKLSSHILNSFSSQSEKEIASQSEEERKTFLKAMDGIRNYMLLQEEMLSKLMNQQDLIYTKP